jgi:cytochrome b pre-mRNA-processing protein 3
MLNWLGGQSRRVAEELFARLSQRAREPVFFERFGIADTIDGRFDILVVHAWLVLDRLVACEQQSLMQALVDVIFVQFDEALRQQGAGDIGMGRRMTKMADAFYGRLKAYREAESEAALADSFVRNVWRGDTGRLDRARALAKYVQAARAALSRADLAAGVADFGPPPSGIDHD